MKATQTRPPRTLAVSRPQPRVGMRTTRLLHQILVYALLIGLGIVFILPFMWMISTSLKQSRDVFTFPPHFLPTSFEWRNYVTGWTRMPFTRFLENSLIVTGANVVGNLLSCSLVAYGFARLRARGRDVLFLLLLGTLMIPREVTIVPTFILFTRLHLVNTLWPLILPAWFGYPFFVFLLRQFFMSLPHELDEAARIDGASSLRIFSSITLPLSKPALGTVAIFSFIGNWNNLLDPLIYLRSTEKFTLALGLSLFQGEHVTQYNELMAVSIIQILPILILFFLAQKYFVQGVALSGMGGR